MWWIYWAAARADASLLALSYHGGCTPNFAQLCTSEADWIALRGQELNRCEESTSSTLGCLERAHGMIEPYGVGWIATTGEEPLVQYGRDGRVLRELHTGIRRDHVMNFAFTPDRVGLYIVSSCLYSREGLRRVSLTSGTSRLVRGKICGESLAVGRTAILVRRTNAIELRRPGTARLRRQIRFGANVLDMIVAG